MWSIQKKTKFIIGFQNMMGAHPKKSYLRLILLLGLGRVNFFRVRVESSFTTNHLNGVESSLKASSRVEFFYELGKSSSPKSLKFHASRQKSFRTSSRVESSST